MVQDAGGQGVTVFQQGIYLSRRELVSSGVRSAIARARKTLFAELGEMVLDHVYRSGDIVVSILSVDVEEPDSSDDPLVTVRVRVRNATEDYRG